MQQKVKYRLAGLAVMLISAAIIFPVFFDGAGYQERHLSSAIPDAPERPEIVSITPKKHPLPVTDVYAEPSAPLVLPEPTGEVKKNIEKVVKTQKVDTTIAQDQPVLDQQGVPVAWTLQLASFKDESNAKDLRKQLINAGHKVFTRKQGDLVKVYVGPELQKTRLEALQENLKKEFGLSGIIVRFTTQ